MEDSKKAIELSNKMAELLSVAAPIPDNEPLTEYNMPEVPNEWWLRDDDTGKDT